MTQFRLDTGEALHAAIAGLQRQFRAIQRQAKNNYGNLVNDEFSTNVHAAIAEATVAKLLGLYANLSTSDRTVADVGNNIEVRSTLYKKGSLILHEKDKDDRKYYLVCGMYPDLTVVGWRYGHECKKDRYWVTKDKEGKKLEHPYWMVPQSDLNPELIEVVL